MNIAALIIASLMAYGPWESIGPEGGEVRAILQSTQDTSVLFALSGSNPAQVIRSQNGGGSWENISEISNCYPYDMVMTADGSLVVFGSSRTWTSADGGYTWNDTYMSNTIFWDGEPHPTEGGRVYAAGYKYDGASWNMSFFSSTDCGAGWSYTTLVNTVNTSYGRCVAVSESDPDQILVGGYEYMSGYTPYLFKSVDGGASFTDVTPSAAGYYFSGADFHPANPSIMLVGDLISVFRSTDGGSSWTSVGNPTYSYDLTFSEVNPNMVFSAGMSRIYRSTNAGQSWTTVTSGLFGDNINWIEPDAVNSSIVYTGSTAGFFISSNGGQSWTCQNSGLTMGRALAMEEVNGWIFMNLESMGLWKAQDGPTITWQEVTTPLTCGDFCALEAVGSNTILALEGTG
ncbi:MAG: hypothetical protein JXA64_00510 [Candidatus Fermentibacteraceae bacterium]|nr:hypothetical protein [Candidatus Fermentibacteraceae bacterium]MBN2607567.1 hypothetical protein [Candidatus Fermentibacteraceae bacterium]